MYRVRTYIQKEVHTARLWFKMSRTPRGQRARASGHRVSVEGEVNLKKKRKETRNKKEVSYIVRNALTRDPPILSSFIRSSVKIMSAMPIKTSIFYLLVICIR